MKNIQHPITLARMVMEKTPHALLVAHGANKFAKEMGMQTLPLESLVSKEAIDDWEKYVALQVLFSAPLLYHRSNFFDSLVRVCM